MAFRIPDIEKRDRERKKQERLRLELREAEKPLNPGGSLPAEAKNLIRHRVKNARNSQTWHPDDLHRRTRLDWADLLDIPDSAPDDYEG